ncbi:MAG: tetratricopeptide repeat protein, partial [Candidatus Gastranaerophilales bacterium]|nr:tetratricopeptide repeat protein [Candidatus Gastranaerophilales bacterium]
KKLLELAKKSHEQYLVKQQEIDLNNAIDYYVRAMKLTPHLSEPYYKLAILLYNKRQISLDQALKQCKKAVLLDPTSPMAKLYYGYFLNLSGQVKLAKQEFQKAIKLNFFTSSKARIALALSIFKDMKQGNNSISNFTKAMYYLLTGSALTLLDYPTISMLYKVVLSNIAVFYYYLKGFFLKRVNNYAAATKTYEVAAKNTPSAENFYMLAGDSAYKKDNFPKAIEAYKKAIELNPTNDEAVLKLKTILQNHCKNKEQELIECYNRLIKTNERDARLYYDLGNLYLKTDDVLSALNAFKIALEIEPENPFFMNSYAYILIQLKNYDEALLYYKKAIKINPDNKWTSILCLAQGSIYQQVKHNPEAALTSYEMATVLDPENYDAYFSIGEVYQELDEFEDAIENYCYSLKLKETLKGYKALGILLWLEDKVDEAIVAFEKCICMDEDDAESYINLGVALLDGQGNIDRATECFKNAIELNPNEATAYYNMGRVYQIMQMPENAAENYQMAINLNKITNVMDGEEIESRLHALFNVIE